MKTKYNETQVTNIINEYFNSTLTQKEIGLKYDLSQTAITYYLRKRGLKSKPTVTEDPRIINKVIEQYILGIDQQDIAKELNINSHTIRKILLQEGIEIRSKGGYKGYRKYTIDHNYFKTIDSHDKAYILGMIFTDGHLDLDKKNTLVIGLSNKDRNILEVISDKLGSNAPIKDYVDERYDSPRLKSVLSISSKQLLIDLQQYGLTQNKTLTIKFPKSIDDEYMNSFILGCLDGDGTWHEDGGFPVFSIVSASEFFLLDMQKYLMDRLDLNIVQIYKATHYKDGSPRKNPLYRLKWKGFDNCIPLYEYLYKNASIHLDRKHDKIKSILDSRVIKKLGRPRKAIMT